MVSFSGKGLIKFCDATYSYVQVVVLTGVCGALVETITQPLGEILVKWKNRKRGGKFASYS